MVDIEQRLRFGRRSCAKSMFEDSKAQEELLPREKERIGAERLWDARTFSTSIIVGAHEKESWKEVTVTNRNEGGKLFKLNSGIRYSVIWLVKNLKFGIEAKRLLTLSLNFASNRAILTFLIDYRSRTVCQIAIKMKMSHPPRIHHNVQMQMLQ